MRSEPKTFSSLNIDLFRSVFIKEICRQPIVTIALAGFALLGAIAMRVLRFGRIALGYSSEESEKLSNVAHGMLYFKKVVPKPIISNNVPQPISKIEARSSLIEHVSLKIIGVTGTICALFQPALQLFSRPSPDLNPEISPPTLTIVDADIIQQHVPQIIKSVKFPSINASLIPPVNFDLSKILNPISKLVDISLSNPLYELNCSNQKPVMDPLAFSLETTNADLKSRDISSVITISGIALISIAVFGIIYLTKIKKPPINEKNVTNDLVKGIAGKGISRTQTPAKSPLSRFFTILESPLLFLQSPSLPPEIQPKKKKPKQIDVDSVKVDSVKKQLFVKNQDFAKTPKQNPQQRKIKVVGKKNGLPPSSPSVFHDSFNVASK